jgi:hypothetical protein
VLVFFARLMHSTAKFKFATALLIKCARVCVRVMAIKPNGVKCTQVELATKTEDFSEVDFSA